MTDQPVGSSVTLLEQYKLYVEMADRISQRRVETNRFYVTLLTGLLAIVSLAFENAWVDVGLQRLVLGVMSGICIGLCIIWWANITSYRQVNSVKFAIVGKMEERLSYPCYSQEWNDLGEGKELKKYLPVSHIECVVPIVIGIPYLGLLAYSIFFWS